RLRRNASFVASAHSAPLRQNVSSIAARARLASLSVMPRDCLSSDQIQLDATQDTGGRPLGNIYYGTSSWTDRTLLASKRFYPSSARSAEERLRFYAERFPLVEVDSTYYGLPSERNAALWA